MGRSKRNGSNRLQFGTSFTAWIPGAALRRGTVFSGRLQSYSDSVISPASFCFAITPSDSQDLAYVTKAIYIGESGDLVLRSLSGPADVIFTNVVAGTVLDVRASAIRATGTSEAGLVGLA